MMPTGLCDCRTGCSSAMPSAAVPASTRPAVGNSWRSTDLIWSKCPPGIGRLFLYAVKEALNDAVFRASALYDDRAPSLQYDDRQPGNDDCTADQQGRRQGFTQHACRDDDAD